MANNRSVKRIMYLRYCEDITQTEHSNIDVIVELQNGSKYVVFLATAKTLDYLMRKDKLNYLSPGLPPIIVKTLTKDIIVETIKAYAEAHDGYWLKLHHFAIEIDENVFNKLEAEELGYKELSDEELDKPYEIYEAEE